MIFHSSPHTSNPRNFAARQQWRHQCFFRQFIDNFSDHSTIMKAKK